MISDKPETNIPQMEASPSTLKVLQISDIHFDPKYEAGMPADCTDLLCCRDNSISANGAENMIPAGEYGTVTKCDIPYKTVISFFDEVLGDGKEHPDLILWTGDNPQHSIWDITLEEVADNAINITALIKNRYAYKGQVVPVWGNHGVAPNDQYEYYTSKDAGVRSTLADLWHDFIGDDAYLSFKRTGYYSVPIDASLGLKGRFIVINCLLHDALNFYLIADQTDPMGLFAFMEEQLRQAEQNGEIAYIVGHIPPGDGYSLDPFNKRYNALIDRYTNTIRGQFFAHTHNDEFKMTQSYASPGRQSGVQFIVPSLTTFPNINPSFRIYEFDRQTGFTFDYVQYRMYLTKGETDWKIAYTMKNFYGVKDGSDYAGFQAYALKMRTDPTTYNAMMAMYAGEGTGNWPSKYMDILSCQFQYSVFEDVLTCGNTLICKRRVTLRGRDHVHLLGPSEYRLHSLVPQTQLISLQTHSNTLY